MDVEGETPMLKHVIVPQFDCFVEKLCDAAFIKWAFSRQRVGGVAVCEDVVGWMGRIA